MRILYKENLLKYITESRIKIGNINEQLGDNDLINQGLFLMTTTYFEATIRDVLKEFLICDPTKFGDKGSTITYDDIKNYGDERVIVIAADNFLFNLFKGNVYDQLIKFYSFISNISESNIRNKKEGICYNIEKISDVSFYRNCLIHNAGRKSKEFDSKVKHFKEINDKLNYSKDNIKLFIA